MLIWGQPPFFNIRATIVMAAALGMTGCGNDVAQIAGTWSGSMMLDGGKGPTFVHIAVTFTQDGERIGGTWRALDETTRASGEVSGTLTRENDRQAVNMNFTFAGRHPIESSPGVNCAGSARSEGQLTFNTTVDTAGGPSPERPGWGIRLKAFDGFRFESCPAIRYATWTLTRGQ